MFQFGWLHNLSVAHIHTPSCTPLVGDTVFQGFRHLPTLTTHSSQIAYSQQAPFPSDWWLHLLYQARTSTTFPSPYNSPGPFASVGVYAPNLTRPPLSNLHIRASENRMLVSPVWPRYPSHDRRASPLASSSHLS